MKFLRVIDLITIIVNGSRMRGTAKHCFAAYSRVVAVRSRDRAQYQLDRGLRGLELHLHLTTCNHCRRCGTTTITARQASLPLPVVSTIRTMASHSTEAPHNLAMVPLLAVLRGMSHLHFAGVKLITWHNRFPSPNPRYARAVNCVRSLTKS
ncbi:hypothetical protein CYLTODRAFT_116834 [Cylindrobasidium torrendii FP15055 ss-10]|uniref:Uncharacterized protein n=1 Tax=Cylindrobasidium torrendii FP15055 ss-10 TaxID=1314674 RepID=A0A0D7BMT3_9AGAR|nr:hypothetical protein CYLTODRAFT_116834 [Cylindrobasidium torrendii FP15055 ss-10]